MKKIAIAVVVCLLISFTAACGKRRDPSPTTNTTIPITIPLMDPTLDTNIPDPHINTEIPTYTDGTDTLDEIIPDMTN